MSRAFRLIQRADVARGRALLLAVALLVAPTAAADGASVVDPILRFQAIASEHFVVYFQRGADRLASRLADIAEETWRELQAQLGVDAPRRTYVVLVDQSEIANGWATPLPYNTVVVAAAWPSGSDFTGNTDDWLRVVFAHEFAHIVHLDRSVGWARLVRGVFGRAALAFPNLLLPAWQIEGLATYEESARTGAGRLSAGNFRAIERHGGAVPLDRANGGLTSWPGALAPYAYGAGFHEYLVERFGEAALGELARATAGRVPFTASPMFRRVFGEPLGRLWAQYLAVAMSGNDGRAPDPTPMTRLTRHGYTVLAPRFARACAGCAPEILYTVRTPDAFSTLHRIALDGTAPTSIVTRYFGSTHAATEAVVLFDRPEIRRNVGVYSDLYEVDRTTGRVRALTRDARLLDPDLSPDGSTIVCVREGLGHRELTLIPYPPYTRGRARSTPDAYQRDGPAVVGRTLVSEADTQFNAPRWSPDGRRIAVERHRRGAFSEIVVVEASSGAVHIVAARPGARFTTPTWRPDGRAVVAAGAIGADPFNLYEFALDASAPARQLTFTAAGATWPDVAADGRTIVFAGYTSDGFEVFTMPYPDSPSSAGASARVVVPSLQALAQAEPQATPPPISGVPRPYAQWAKLAPRSWTPLVVADSDQVRLGIASGGADVLRYHGYTASASWLVSGPPSAAASTPGSPDWSVGYAYSRWRPSFAVAASRATSFFPDVARAEAGAPATVVERRVEAGFVMPFQSFERSHVVLASVAGGADDYAGATLARRVNRSSVRLGWASSTPNTYGFSISPEDGLTIGATTELGREALGASTNATTSTFDGRAYVSGLGPHHVVALRAAAGVSSDRKGGRVFRLGGASPNPSVASFASDAISLLRGFGPDSFFGSRVALVNADYRWPIVRPQRGAGTWPIFVHTVHAAIAADAGHAWSGGARLADAKTSLGAELAVNVVVGYSLPLTLTFGGAWGHDGASGSDRGVAYLRVGRAF